MEISLNPYICYKTDSGKMYGQEKEEKKMEEQLRNGAMTTARIVRAVFTICGLMCMILPIMSTYAGSTKQIPLGVLIKNNIFLYVIYIIGGLLIILWGMYLYYLLATQAYIVYNSRRITDSTDVIETNVRRMFGNVTPQITTPETEKKPPVDFRQ